MKLQMIQITNSRNDEHEYELIEAALNKIIRNLSKDSIDYHVVEKRCTRLRTRLIKLENNHV